MHIKSVVNLCICSIRKKTVQQLPEGNDLEKLAKYKKEKIRMGKKSTDKKGGVHQQVAVMRSNSRFLTILFIDDINTKKKPLAGKC